MILAEISPWTRLTRMRSFVDVVREGGYSAAARATGRSKAILSKDVRELEDFLGVRLLTRTTRSVAATEAGQTYFEEALAICSPGSDSLQERMREQRRHAAWTVARFGPAHALRWADRAGDHGLCRRLSTGAAGCGVRGPVHRHGR
jgi:DNA-binding transcriptional LysR family regulator